MGWLPANLSDPWHRSPGFMGSDAEAANGKGAALVEEPRVFMAGMSDESGASAPLAMAVKQLGLPVASEVAKLEEYVFEAGRCSGLIKALPDFSNIFFSHASWWS